ALFALVLVHPLPPQLQQWNDRLENMVRYASRLYDDAVKLGMNENRSSLKKEFNKTYYESRKIYYNALSSTSSRNIYNQLTGRREFHGITPPHQPHYFR